MMAATHRVFITEEGQYQITDLLRHLTVGTVYIGTYDDCCKAITTVKQALIERKGGENYRSIRKNVTREEIIREFNSRWVLETVVGNYRAYMTTPQRLGKSHDFYVDPCRIDLGQIDPGDNVFINSGGGWKTNCAEYDFKQLINCLSAYTMVAGDVATLGRYMIMCERVVHFPEEICYQTLVGENSKYFKKYLLIEGTEEERSSFLEDHEKLVDRLKEMGAVL